MPPQLGLRQLTDEAIRRSYLDLTWPPLISQYIFQRKRIHMERLIDQAHRWETLSATTMAKKRPLKSVPDTKSLAARDRKLWEDIHADTPVRAPWLIILRIARTSSRCSQRISQSSSKWLSLKIQKLELTQIITRTKRVTSTPRSQSKLREQIILDSC